MKIIEAVSEAHIETARLLFREYQAFLNVDLCFQGFEEELANLPGKYASPQGAILLAMEDDIVLGCVAVRPLKDDVCEMKRLYVLPQGQGKGIGRKLAEAILAKAKALGYQTMQLDTLERLQAAINLYKSLGFKSVNPYYANPLEQVVYLELDLNHN